LEQQSRINEELRDLKEKERIGYVSIKEESASIEAEAWWTRKEKKGEAGEKDAPKSSGRKKIRKRGDDEEVRMKIGRLDTPGDKDFEEELGRLRIEIKGAWSLRG